MMMLTVARAIGTDRADAIKCAFSTMTQKSLTAMEESLLRGLERLDGVACGNTGTMGISS